MSIHLFIQEEVEITEACWEWCSEQQIIHASNIEIQGLFILLLTAASLLVHIIIYKFYDKIKEHEEVKEEVLDKVYLYSSDFALYLIIGYFIFLLWI